MGNRLQEKMWPRWPHDSPTNRWLHPEAERTSRQQRELWYGAVKRVIGVDIGLAVASGEEVDATINDAVSALRNIFWERPEATRLRMHNVDYGFARNLTGLRPVWMAFSLASATACWVGHFVIGIDILSWVVLSTLLALLLVPVAVWVLPGYVETKANYYAESFFGTLTASTRLMRTESTSPPRRTGRVYE